MITYYSLIFLITTVIHVKTQYLLGEYASKHDNYEPAHYSFAYGVSDPHTGDHKHHWETREGDNVKGEYGLLDADGVTRIVQYTSDPHHGFQAIVRRLHIPPEQYTSGQLLYGIRNGGLYNTNPDQQNQSGEEAVGTDHGAHNQNIENQHQEESSQEESDNHYGNEDASSENSYVKVGDVLDCVRKQIVKKDNAETHFSYPSSIVEIENAANEKQEVQNTNLKKDISDNIQNENQNNAYVLPLRYGQPEFQPKLVQTGHYTSNLPFVNQNIPNVLTANRRAFEEIPTHNIQEEIPLKDSNIQNEYHIQQNIPNVYHNLNQNPIPTVYTHRNQVPVLPQPQAYNIDQGILFGRKILSNHFNPNSQQTIPISSYQGNFESVQTHQISQTPQIPQTSPVADISSTPQINIENVKQLPNPQLVDKTPRKSLSQQNEFPLILVDTHAQFGYPFYPHTQVNGLFQIVNGQIFGYEGIPVASTNIHNQQGISQNNNVNANNNNDVNNAQSNQQNEQRRIDNYFNNYAGSNNNFPAGGASLNERNSLPSGIYNFQFNGFDSVPQNDQSVNTYQEKPGQGVFTSANQNYPAGSSRKTIWNAGDATADREVEVLVRQLNETCAYFQFNETTPGTEDGSKPNIFNAGDYTAQQEETELIRSVNVTCDNFSTDALNNFTSGFTLAQYCSQCYENDTNVKNNENRYNPNQPDNYLNNFNIPTNFDNNFWIPPNIFGGEYLNIQPAVSAPLPFYYDHFGRSNGEANERTGNIYKRSRVKRYEETKTVEEKAI